MLNNKITFEMKIMFEKRDVMYKETKEMFILCHFKLSCNSVKMPLLM